MSWALLVLLAATTTWAIYTSRGWLNEKDATRTAEDMLRGTKKLVDQQAAEIASLKTQVAAAKALAKIAQDQRNQATAAKTKATVDKIKAATPKEAAKLINETAPAQPAVVVDIKTGGPITELK